MTVPRLDLIRDDELRLVPDNFRRVQEWGKGMSAAVTAIEDELDSLGDAIEEDTGEFILEGDPRLSDAREPLPHTHAAAEISDLDEATAATSSYVLLERKFLLLLKYLILLGFDPPPGLGDDIPRALATD